MSEYKPGVIVQCKMPGNSGAKKFAGTIHIIKKACDVYHHSWHLDPPTIHPGGSVITWAEEHLRIIRDPGDDASDETLEWLPVPSKEKEVA